MRTQFVLISLAVACLTCNSAILATDRLVPNQYPTIQAAIDDCNNGDVVIVAPGTYTGTGNKNLDFGGKAITVQSIDPADPCVVAATVIDSQNVSGHRGFYFHSGEGPDSVVRGFTITGGNAAGGGIYCVDSSPTISRCIITGNRTRDGSNSYGFSGFAGNGEDGGGVYCNGSSAVIENSVIMWNRTGNGGTAYSLRSRPDDEPAGPGGDGGRGGGLFGYNSVLVIANCVIAGNVTGKGGDSGKPLDLCAYGGGGDGGGGGGICVSESLAVFISNCTIAGNETGAGGVGYGCANGSRGVGGGVYCGASTLDVTNGIIWDNSPSQMAGSTIVANYSDIEGGWPGVGIIDINPCFVNAGVGDYHLPRYSPCVDAGDPGYSPVPGETDIDGEPRVVYGRIDMGADEGYYETPLIQLSATEFIVYAFEGGSNPADLVLSIRNRGSGILNWEIMEDCSWVEVDPNNGESSGEPDEVVITIDTTGLCWGQYSCELTISDPCAANSPLRVEIRLMLRQLGILLVPSEYPTIQAGIDAAQPGNTVIVAEGTYTGAGNKNLDFGGKSITVRSTDPNDPCVVAGTVIDCQSSGRGFSFHHGEEPNSIVSGLTIRNGYVSATGGGIICSYSSPTISNCIIRGNRTGGFDDYPGGGIYSSGAPVIKGCTIEDNSGRDGGGIFCFGNTMISNCIIKNNVAEGWWYSPDHVIWWPMPGFGGGIYCTGSGTIIRNCVISGNDAAPFRHLPDYYHDGGGGGICSRGSNKIINCLIYGNWGGGWNTVGSGGGGILFWNYVSTVENCTIADNLAYRGTGLFFYGGSATIINSIIWGNNISNGSPEITFSDVQGGWPGEGNIDTDPCFASGPLADYYLSQAAAGQAVDSPCVDAGSDTADNMGMDSFTTRTDEFLDKGIVDMGYHYPAIIEYGNPDMDGDGDVDFFDYAWFAIGWPDGTLNQIPRGSVVVDGDLSDWSEGVKWVELDKVFYGNPNDVSDARFALQWNGTTNKVYAAIVVNDTNHIFLDEYVKWDASDRLEIYSQGDATGGSGWGRIYDVAQQYFVAPNSTGDGWASWAFGETLGEDAGFEYAVTVDGDRIIYEVGVRMFDNYGGFSGGETVITNLSEGHVIGFDLVASTRWAADGFGMLSENMMTGKSGNADQFRRYILVDTFSSDMDRNGAINYADLGIITGSWLWGK